MSTERYYRLEAIATRLEAIAIRLEAIECKHTFTLEYSTRMRSRHSQDVKSMSKTIPPPKGAAYPGPYILKDLRSFSRRRSEGFPFIVGGLGVGAVFAWLASSVVVCRRLSSSLRLKFAAIGGSFCK